MGESMAYHTWTGTRGERLERLEGSGCRSAQEEGRARMDADYRGNGSYAGRQREGGTLRLGQE